MPIRIYALAKELRVDSKQLVDICNKAGVSGKGSALASLNDEEIAKVKAYLVGGKPSGKGGGAKTAVALKPKAVKDSTAAITREDYIAPGRGGGKIKVIQSQPKKDETDTTKKDTSGGTGKADSKKEPVVKLAAIPKAKHPTAAPKSKEPSPQKPIMTLPKDAIRGAKAGSQAPLQQFTRQHEKKRKAGGDKKDIAASKSSASPGQPPLGKTPSRDRRRSKIVEEGPEKGKGKGLAGMAGSRAARQQHRKSRRGPAQGLASEEDRGRPRRGRRLTRKGTNTAAPRKGKVVVEVPCSLRAFSEAAGVPNAQILHTLMQLGTMATINAQIDAETAELLATELELDIEIKQIESLEETVLAKIKQTEDAPEDLLPRPPVVTFLGHVDHGKTSLLDKIIGIDVVTGEAGGITQHIRAYSITKGDRRISFVDTPGHEAFTEMRARGANVNDIAVLVVAADDGIMPQTEEAISHAKAAEVPIVVALNKIDLPGANVERVLQQLSTHELLPSEWGGDVEVVQTSAMTGEGIDKLLETLLLTADLHEYKANPNRQAWGVCLEAEQEPGRGVIAKLIIQNGTLQNGDVVVCGTSYGRVKAMYDTLRTRRKVKTADPGTPVNVTGLDEAPEAGESFYVLDDIAEARRIAQHRAERNRDQSLGGQTVRISFEEFQRRMEEGTLGTHEESGVLNLIIRADVRGSIEAIQKEFDKLEHPEVKINILQASVGGITVGDVTLADASRAVVIGFNVIPDEAARALADKRGVEIRRYDIIYKITDDMKALLEGKLKPEQRINDLGRALVQRTFTISRLGTVAGCRVLAGKIERGSRVRVNREGRGIGDYLLDSLRREKDDAKEVREGFECGMKLVGFNDLKEGDVLEAYKIEEVARQL